VRAAEPLTKAAKISLDPAGVLVVDGRKVFPITLTVVPTPEQMAPSGKQAYAQFADDGVMFMRSGKPDWNAETIAGEKAMQAAADGGVDEAVRRGVGRGGDRHLSGELPAGEAHGAGEQEPEHGGGLHADDPGGGGSEAVLDDAADRVQRDDAVGEPSRLGDPV